MATLTVTKTTRTQKKKKKFMSFFFTVGRQELDLYWVTKFSKTNFECPNDM